MIKDSVAVTITINDHEFTATFAVSSPKEAAAKAAEFVKHLAEELKLSPETYDHYYLPAGKGLFSE